MRRNPCFVAIIFLALLPGCSGTAGDVPVATTASGFGTHYVVTGTGEPVVLVHGFSQTHAAWLDTPLFQDLTRDHKVIAVDLRGHGDSDKPHDPMAYGRHMQADLAKLLDHLDIDEAHFVGFSMGASIVGDLLVSSPGRVRTAAMISGYFTTWHESEEEFAQEIENRESEDERFPWEPANQDYRALAAAIRGIEYAVVSPDEVASIKTPTLIVFGSIELEHMPESRRTGLENMPGSVEVLIIDGADHDSSNAAVLNPALSRAVREHIAANSAH
ncbi:MAG: alpha/beta fold hydrolase [Woeseiaceae bacterium]